METVLLIISSVALVLSFLSMVWIFKCKSCIERVSKLSAVFIFAFACWEFAENLNAVEHIVNSILVKTFILFTTVMNSYYTWQLAYHRIQIVEDRRRQNERRKHPGHERRKTDRNLIS
jgi:hypothetical protein